MTDRPFAILFVCLGNICRSPLAEGAFRQAATRAGLAQRFRIDSAGLGDYHVGHPPDRRAIATAARHGIDIAMLRARLVTRADFDRFDLILGMDQSNLAGLLDRAPPAPHAEVALYRARAEGVSAPVPDPYYGTAEDFEAVYQIVARGSAALLDALKPPVRVA